MSKMSLPKSSHDATSQNVPRTEVRSLTPDDAWILVYLAHSGHIEESKRRRLVSMLSEEGKLIARALRQTTRRSSLPANVLETADALRERFSPVKVDGGDLVKSDTRSRKAKVEEIKAEAVPA